MDRLDILCDIFDKSSDILQQDSFGSCEVSNHTQCLLL